MAFSIYTISDPVVLGSAMTSMAMFFGQESWVASALKTGLILSLLFILIQGVSQKFRLDVMLIQLLAVWVMFIPKTTVTIEQFDNSAPPRVVDGVPYAIALPASVAGAFAMYMTQKIEAVMVSADGDYLSVTGDVHPFSPARMLMAFTQCPTSPLTCVDQNMTETLRLAARYCAGPKMSEAKFFKSKQVISDFAATLTEPGSTVIYDSANPFKIGGGGGRAASCDEVRTYLTSYENSVAAGGNADFRKTYSDIAQSAQSKNNKSVLRDDGQIDYDQALKSINQLTDSNSKIDDRALLNLMTYSVADSLKYEATAPIDQPISLRRDAGLFDWAKTEANQSMLVSTAAPKFMDVLFFVFIASTPIVMFVVAANPQSGLKVAGSYAMFGIWTQSWIPMMAIITAWYQREVLNIGVPSTGLGAGTTLSPEYMAFMMRHILTTTIAAGNMIQSAPYMMFAILTGSMMAMSSMIGKAVPSGGSGQAGEAIGGAGGSGGSGGTPKWGAGASAVAQKAAIAGAQNAHAYGMTSDAVGMTGGSAANLPGLADVNLGGQLGADVAAAHERSAGLQKQLQASKQQALNEAKSLITSAMDSIDGKTMAGYMTNAGYKTSWDSGTNTMTFNGETFKWGRGASNDQTFTTGFSGKLGLGGGILGAVISALGIQASAALNAGLTENTRNQVTAGTEGSGGSRSGTSNSTAAQRTQGVDATQGPQGSKGSQWSQLAQKSKQLGDTMSKVASQTQALDEANKLTSRATLAATGASGVQLKGSDVVDRLAQQAVAKGGRGAANEGEATQRVMSSLGGALTGEALGQFQKKMAANLAQMRDSGLGNSLGHDAMANAAAWNALNSMVAQAPDASGRLNALGGIAALLSSAGIANIKDGVDALKDANTQFSKVQGAIGNAEGIVGTAVDGAVQTVEKALSPDATKAFESKVDEEIAKRKDNANNIYNKAAGGIDAAVAGGKDAVATAQANNLEQERRARDPSQFQPQIDKARKDMSAIPTEGRMAKFAAGEDISLQKLASDFIADLGEASRGPHVRPANTPLGEGPRTRPDFHPNQTLANAGSTSGGAAPAEAPSPAKDLVPNFGLTLGSMTDASTSFVTTMNNAASAGVSAAAGLPTLGIGGAPLATGGSGGGGGAPVVAESDQSGSGKPGANMPPSGDSKKSNIPRPN